LTIIPHLVNFNPRFSLRFTQIQIFSSHPLTDLVLWLLVFCKSKKLLFRSTRAKNLINTCKLTAMIHDAALGIAVLLAAGLAAAKLTQLFHLPSVTGFILAGLLLGESGFGLVTDDLLGHQLHHFTSIALMLIAFGIGEHVELRRLKGMERTVLWIAVVQAVAAFALVTVAAFAVLSVLTESAASSHLTLALLLGAIAAANAPATLLHVVQELNARGPMTSTLMASVAVGDALAIMIFGMALSAARNLAGPGQGLLLCFYETGGSLAVGIGAGLLLDKILDKLRSQGEMLTAGLALLLLSGELSRLAGLSPLLVGMAVGFIIINNAERDVRLFRIINGFEPPIYVLFFTLAGAHLNLSALMAAGWLGLTYFLARMLGKYCGSWLGAWLAGAQKTVRNYLGLSFIPQAGMAIGFVFLISADQSLAQLADIITPVVLAGVMLSEIFGPLLVGITLNKAGEIQKTGDRESFSLTALFKKKQGNRLRLEPWTKQQFHPAAHPTGTVLIGAAHFATVRALTRTATIIADHLGAQPMSVRVISPESPELDSKEQENFCFPEIDEARMLGYQLQTKLIHAEKIDAALADAAQNNEAAALVIGYPVSSNPLKFHKMMERITDTVSCPVIAVRFVGSMICQRILVPFIRLQDLDSLRPVLEAMTAACGSKLTFQHLLPAESSLAEEAEAEQILEAWVSAHFYGLERPRCLAESTESRLESVLREAEEHDLIIMTAERVSGLQRRLFGTLADAVLHNCGKPALVVHTAKNALVPNGKPSETAEQAGG
jgi:Kef-type K+ transport system membrane component KefB/nucleotide-binding universal stress UspA family protein